MTFPFNVLILAAGFGTRLGDFGRETPKGLIKIGEGTILDFLLAALAPTHPLSVTLLTNQLHYPDYQKWQLSSGSHIKLIHNQVLDPKNRLGALKDAADTLQSCHLDKHDLLILPSDTLFDFSLTKFLTFAGKHPLGLSTVFRAFPDESAIKNRLGCGVIVADYLLEFYEKPDVPKTHYGAIPLYYYPASTLPKLRQYVEAHPSLPDLDAPGSIIPWLLSQEKPVFAHIVSGHTLDVGTPADLATAGHFKVK